VVESVKARIGIITMAESINSSSRGTPPEADPAEAISLDATGFVTRDCFAPLAMTISVSFHENMVMKLLLAGVKVVL
jgi:hypothetical protein